MSGAKYIIIIYRFFGDLFQTNAMQMNLRDEARDFNKNLRQFQKNGLNDFETHKDTEKEENLPLRTS